jgi:restriction system protein
MARRKTSTAEDIIEIVSRFPWWVGCLLALISFIILHLIAGIEVTKPQGAQGLGGFAGKQLYVTLAGFAQFVLPALFLFGAVASAIIRVKQKNRFDAVAANPHASSLNNMTWQQFEGLTAEFFRRRGYTVMQKGGDQPDGGVDLVLSKGSDKYLVQCKQWKAYKVGVQVVRELYGVMAKSGAAGGFVITSGQFSDEAKKFAEGLNIHLFDRTILHKMIREVNRHQETDDSAQASMPANPICPKCSKQMVRRVAKQGPTPGNEFWGCSGYPQCRGTISGS